MKNKLLLKLVLSLGLLVGAVSAYAANTVTMTPDPATLTVNQQGTTTLTYNVVNDSGQSTIISQPSLAFSPADQNVVSATPYTNTCTGLIANGGTCQISYTITGTNIGTTSAVLNVIFGSFNIPASSSPATITVSGPAPTWSIDTGAVLNSNLTLGGEGTTASFTINNTSNVALDISSIVPTVTNNSPAITVAAGTDGCGSQLAGNSTCTYVANVTPAAVGTATVTLTVNTSNGGVQQNNSSAITVSSNPATWNVAAGAPSAVNASPAQPITIDYTVANTSTTTAITLSAPTVTASNNAILKDLVVNSDPSKSTCLALANGQLNPGTQGTPNTCTYEVDLQAALVGQASVTLTANATGGTQVSESATSANITVSNIVWSLTAATPNPTSVNSGQTTSVVYTVKNNSTYEAIKIYNLTASSSDTNALTDVTGTGSGTNPCSNNLSLGIGDSCTYTVTATAGSLQSDTTASLSLNVNTSDDSGNVTAENTPSATITVLASGPVNWSVTAGAPSATSVTPDQPITINYTVSNPSTTTAITLQQPTVSSTDVSGTNVLKNLAVNSDTTQSTCLALNNGELGPGTNNSPSTCTYQVTLQGNTYGSATVTLTANATGGAQPSEAATSAAITVGDMPVAVTAGTPNPTSVNSGQTTSVVYTVKNNSGFEAITLTGINATSSDNTALTNVTESGSGNNPCSNNLALGATDSCTLTVTATAGNVQSTTSATVGLSITATDHNSNSVTTPATQSSAITVNSSGNAGDLAFLQQPQIPTLSNVQDQGNSITVDYVVVNHGTTDIQLNPQDITFSSNPGITYTLGTITGCADDKVTANNEGYCTIPVQITVASNAATGNINGSMSIAYGGQSPLTAAINFTVASNVALIFSQVPGTTNISYPNYSTVTYQVTNTTADPITINSASLIPDASSSLVKLADGTEGNPNPSFSTTTVSGNGSATITANVEGQAGAGRASEQLSVNYGNNQTVLSPSTSFVVSNPQAAFVFVEQPSPVNMEPSTANPAPEPQVLTYKVKNNSADPITVNVSLADNDPSSPAVPNQLTSESLSVCGGDTTPYTPGVTSPVAGQINSGASCNIVLTLNSGPTAGMVDQTLTITPNTGTTLNTPVAFQVVSLTNARQITFVNNCKSTVWVGLSTASVDNNTGATPASTSCTSDQQCFKGSTCINTGSGGQCFWVAPTPVLNPNNAGNKSGNPYELQSGDSSSITVPDPGNDTLYPNNVLNGEMNNLTIAGRTGCVGGQCQTSDCSGAVPGYSSAYACAPGKGFLPPFTKGEVNLYNGMHAGAVDFYDVAVIDGFSVPMSIAPTNNPTPDYTGSPFSCGVAGDVNNQGDSAANQIGACSWNFNWSNISALTATPNAMKVVPKGGASCTQDTQCGGGANVCGVSEDALKNAGSGSPATTCGKFLGYWSGGQACSLNPSLGAPFNCGTVITGNQMVAPFNNGSYTLANLFSCNGPSQQQGIGSCYSTSSQNGSIVAGPNNCCGCVNWQAQEGIPLPTGSYSSGNSTAPYVTPCGGDGGNTNAGTGLWESNVQPFVQAYKTGCPSAYSYQFDDPSSTFTCVNNGLNSQAPGSNTTAPTVPNTLGYTVTFCPGNTNTVASAANPDSASALASMARSAMQQAEGKAQQAAAQKQ